MILKSTIILHVSDIYIDTHNIYKLFTSNYSYHTVYVILSHNIFDQLFINYFYRPVVHYDMYLLLCRWKLDIILRKIIHSRKEEAISKIILYIDIAVVRPRNLCNLINLYSSSNTDIYYINWKVCMYFLGILRT